jgi:hypothetical protein
LPNNPPCLFEVVDLSAFRPSDLSSLYSVFVVELLNAPVS